MNKDITLMRKDYNGVKLYDIGTNEQGDFHFIFRKDKRYFGIKVNPNNFDTFDYIEKGDIR